MARYKLHLFGPPRLQRDERLVPIKRRKALALLAYVVHTSQPQSRESLATLLWPDADHASALANLRRVLSHLKSNAGGELLDVDRQKVVLPPELEMWNDVAHFNHLLDGVRAHDHFPDLPCPQCVEHLREAAALYERHFLEGFDLSDAPELDEWAFFERQSLRLALAEALQQLIRSYKGRRQWEDALDYGRRWLALDPLHEAAHRELMALYAYAGQQPFALRQYEECVRLLDAELGIRPQPETTDLYEAIRARRFPDDGQKPPGESAAPAAAGLLPPALQQLGERYLVEEQLATGGQGVVYRGRDMETGEAVIIKQLRSDRLSDPESVARFLREGEALHQLNHPNIVRVLDSFEENDRRAIVMEYVPGGTLRQMLEREGALPLPQALRLGLELADALSRAHHLGILHRDVKPENVLLKESNAPCLSDFGVARLLNEDARLTRTGAVFGSPAYMSPEALRGEELDERSDIWSFGVMLYEMLAGQRPFEGDTVTDVLLKILQEPLPPLPKLRPDLPQALVTLVETMLVKERAQRLNSMRVVASALEAIGANREPEGFNLLAPYTQVRELGQQQEVEVGFIPRTSTPPIAAPSPGATEALPQLPVHAGPFFGREAELQELASMLRDPQVRLLTIMGPGGIGKTQLALQAARTVLPAFPDGVFFVPLAPLSNPADIVFAIAESIDLHFYQPSEAQEQLLQFLQQKSLLLVLDNFEHLLEAASLLADIVEKSTVTILVTSRASLNLTFQTLYTLTGLSFPGAETTDLEQIAAYPAVQLILQQARLILRDFEPDPVELRAAGQIAALVQGMPLALILAARWVELLSMEEIATEIARNLDFLETTMRDVPPRQRSVRAVFDYSWEQLSPHAQEVFARLTIFRGGFTRHAAQQVANADLRTLLTLVRKSFVISRHKNRYEIHELLRQYGAQKLEESGQAQQMRDAHSVYYLNALQERESGLRGGWQARALREIEEDFQNIRAAWNWALERRDKDGINRALEALHIFSDIRSRHQEAAELFARACRTFAPARGQQAELLWGRLVIRHGFLQVLVPSDPHKVEAEIERGLAVAQEHEDRFEIGLATLAKGLLTLVTTQNEPRAAELHRQAIAHFRAVGDDLFLVRALVGLGISMAAHSEPISFSGSVEEAVTIARTAGNKVDIALALSNLAEYAIGTGDYERAWDYSVEAVQLAEEIGVPTVHAFAQMWQAFIHLARGEVDVAAPLLQESYTRAANIHSQTIMAYAAALSALVACFRGDFEEGCRLAQESHDNPANNTLGLVMAPWAMAIAHFGSGKQAAARRALAEGLQKATFVALPEAYLWLIPVAAVLLAAEGQAETAAALLALGMTQPAHARGWWQAWPPLATLQQRLQEELGPTRFQTAWQRGQKLEPHAASTMLGEL